MKSYVILLLHAKIKNFCSSKDTIQGVKSQTPGRENIFVINIINKSFTSRRLFLNVYELVKKRETIQ